MRDLENLTALSACLGKVVAVSDWLAIESARVGNFADATDDRQWIHLDAARAARDSAYGGPIAHGFLTLSLLPCLLGSCVRLHGVSQAINYGVDRVRFPAAVPVGASIRASFVLSGFTAMPAGAHVQWTTTIECEGVAKPACVAVWLMRYYF